MVRHDVMLLLPNKNDIEETWQFLENGINKVMNVDNGEGITTNMYMAIYSAIYNFCTAQKASSPSTAGSAGSRGAHLLGEDIYKKLFDYLTRHLQAIIDDAQNNTEESILLLYNREWQRYTTAAKYINHLFGYLNRHWVKREMDEGKMPVYDAYTLHLVRWRTILFDRLNKPVMDAVLKMVENQRRGETIEYHQIKQVIESFVALGLDDSDPSKSTLDVYRYHFERPFIVNTKEFYTAESKKFLAENSVVDYMIKAEQRLLEEDERVKTYLHPSFGSLLRRACNYALIFVHCDVLRDEFQMLLDHDRQEDMARMFRLLSKIHEGLEPLRQKFENHVRKAGLAAVHMVTANAEGDKIEPKVYVDTLLDVNTRYQELVKRAFNDEPDFTRALDNACREFVNRNDACKVGAHRSPELLAKYVDMLLRKSGSSASEADLENSLNQVMTVFKYIEDKDVFQKYYAKMLSRRLVITCTASEDAETTMISKLKDACGFEYTNKLARMYQDVQNSKDITSRCRAYLEEQNIKTNIDISYDILGTGFWPLTPPTSNFTPPKVINDELQEFVKFYRKQHEGRKLTWLWNLCKGELRANFSRVSKVPYTLIVSAYQMGVLLLFNEKDTNSWEEIVEGTQLSPDIIEGVLGIMTRAKILLQSSGNKIDPSVVFTINRDFKSKKIRIKLDIITTKEVKQEEAETNKTIEEDRKILIQSTMVRIMKARKTMKHQQLVSETISQIKSRFTPKVSDIKKCIDILIDKEYIERTADDEFGYLA